MKKIIIFSVFSLIIGCACGKKITNLQTYYTVTKLDSINNYYLIYAKKNDSVYKIVSKKELFPNCELITLGSNYEFKLKSMRENAPTFRGLKVSPINYMDIKCFQFDENTQICKEAGIYDLYFAENINGLCFIK